MSGAIGISFDEIPYDWRVPGTYAEVKPRYTNLGTVGFSPRVLLMGQKLAAGSAGAGVPMRVTRKEQAAIYFGAGSVAQQMALKFLLANTTSELWVLGLSDAVGSQAATGHFVFTGTATEAGNLAAYVGGRRYAVAVSVGMTAAQLATALALAIQADADRVASAVVSTPGDITMTARNKGTLGNDIDLRLNMLPGERMPAGLTAAITAMTGGAGDVDIAPTLASLAAQDFTDIAIAWSDSANLAALQADLTARYNAMTRRDAHGYYGRRGVLNDLLTAGALRNCQFMTPIGADGSPSSPWEWAASLCGVAAFQLANDPARQLKTLALPGIGAPDPDRCFEDSEQDLLLRKGISTWYVGQDGVVRLQRVVTEYQVSAANVPDVAWLDIMVPKTMSRLRYDWLNHVSLTYPRHKLADDGSLAAEYSDAVVTPRQLHGAWTGRCTLYERLGWIEDTKRTSADAVFQRSLTDRNRVDARQPVRIIGNLMVLATSLEFEV